MGGNLSLHRARSSSAWLSLLPGSTRVAVERSVAHDAFECLYLIADEVPESFVVRAFYQCDYVGRAPHGSRVGDALDAAQGIAHVAFPDLLVVHVDHEHGAMRLRELKRGEKFVVRDDLYSANVKCRYESTRPEILHGIHDL